MDANNNQRIPIQSWRFWGILIFLFGSLMVLTMLKDWWLTREEPNILFYIFVPVLSITGGVLSMYGAAKIGKQTIKLLTLFAISLSANTLMQVVENVLKFIYYQIWAYPSLLYILIVIPLGFLLMVYGLMRWGKVKGRTAIVLTIVDFIGSMIAGVILTDVIGITTPGS